ncbi:MAG: WYL domain-containing protein [Bacillota bacterium]|nr:WYL domain-containing protein [Bacillota bacterium]MDW7682707.1 WYL domain-containing protein [Bacillota bacterium]
MSSFGRTRNFPEALINILLTVINRTPDGGATMDELKDAYEGIKGTRPHERTIRRSIQRLNELFDPLAYEDPVAADPLAIQGAHQNGVMRYRFTRDIISKPVDPSAAFLMAMSIYPQQRNLLGDQFEVVMKLVFEEILSKLTTVYNLTDEIEKYVHVTGASPVEPKKNFAVIDKILQAIRLQKRVKIKYFRSYDAHLTHREIEPYGLICRFNTWYLTGRCCEKNSRRIFLLSQIRSIRIVENSIYTIPEDFCLKDEYCTSWGVWTEEGAPPPETVRLRIAHTMAEKFRNTRFHDSQQLTEQPDGSLEVTYHVSGAQEMLPWLITWGPAVEIQEPAWLRDKLVQILKDTLHIYA